MADIDWSEITGKVDNLKRRLAEVNAAIRELRDMGATVYVHADGNGKNDLIEADFSVDLT